MRYVGSMYFLLWKCLYCSNLQKWKSSPFLSFLLVSHFMELQHVSCFIAFNVCSKNHSIWAVFPKLGWVALEPAWPLPDVYLGPRAVFSCVCEGWKNQGEGHWSFSEVLWRTNWDSSYCLVRDIWIKRFPCFPDVLSVRLENQKRAGGAWSSLLSFYT